LSELAESEREEKQTDKVTAARTHQAYITFMFPWRSHQQYFTHH